MFSVSHPKFPELQVVAGMCDPARQDFALIGEPVEHKQHQNQARGLDLYVEVYNFTTGEGCFKKLYENSSGERYFKHTGFPPVYLKSLTMPVWVVPFQVLYQ